MPGKPKKYGIKIWVLADSTRYFTSNFKIYSGMSNGIRDKNQGENFVLDLTSHLNSGHNIVTRSVGQTVLSWEAIAKKEGKM